MDQTPISKIISDLESDDLIKHTHTLRQLSNLGSEATPVLPRLFDLMINSGPAVSDHCQVVFKQLGHVAIPFLLEKTRDPKPASREYAVSLITDSGGSWHRITVRFATCVLEDRIDPLPDWGCDTEQIFDMYRRALRDESLDVRYAAAHALEAFGVDIESTIPVFIEVLEHGDDGHKFWAALHLGRIGADASQAITALKAATSSKHQYTARAAQNALALIMKHK